MDGSAEEITFDENGVCNFCHQAQRALKEIELEKPNLLKMLERIKGEGCILGLSGGVDSSTVLRLAIRLGLKPFCFSLDNSWNEPKADENIANLVKETGVPFEKVSVDANAYKELQSAFIKAGVPNIEIPTDHILMAITYKMAVKHGVKWILSGGNVATESIMPPSWGYSARDLKHIKAIYKWATGSKLKGLPVCGLLKWNWYRWFKRLKTFYLLDYFDYNRDEAIKELEKEYDYKNYGEKHCESTWTWWFQNYYLYTKFGIDKRKAHFSSLINSGQMTKEKAMELLAYRPVYPELGIEQKVLTYRKHKHEDFPMDKWYGRISRLIKLFNRTIFK
jgi:PP-loop superfamily ATP-utilizing enzyme